MKSHAKIAIQDPLGTKLSMKKLMLGAQVLGLSNAGADFSNSLKAYDDLIEDPFAPRHPNDG